jgi:hypothetical protein
VRSRTFVRSVRMSNWAVAALRNLTALAGSRPTREEYQWSSWLLISAGCGGRSACGDAGARGAVLLDDGRVP